MISFKVVYLFTNFKAYEKRIDGVDEEETEDDFGAHRAAVTKFLNKVLML